MSGESSHVRPHFARERRKNLTEILKKHGFDEESQFSKIDLFTLLDERAKHEFDRTIAAELFSKMDKDHDELISFNEFCDVFVSVEEKLSQEVATYKDRQIELGNFLKTWKRNLNDAQGKEKKNAFGRCWTNEGIMTDATVEVTIKSFKYFEEGIFTRKQADFYFKIGHADFLTRTREYANEDLIEESFKM